MLGTKRGKPQYKQHPLLFSIQSSRNASFHILSFTMHVALTAFTAVSAVLLPQQTSAFSRPFLATKPGFVLQHSDQKPNPATTTKLHLYVEEDKFSTPLAQSDATQSLEDYVKERGGNRVIRKVLIANNGMAATKAILSMRRWAYMELGDENAIQFVAMATPEDIRANAEFVRLADSFVEVPGGKNLFNYANVTVISQVAQEQGVDAVWPGWGHASENPKLPATLDAMGIKFIGPTSPVMSVLGDKIAANILAQTAGLPSVPWSGSFFGENDGPLKAELTEDGTIPAETFEKGCCRTVEKALEVARRIGYENGIMIKASEGGGGKGIRLVYKEEDLPDMFLQVQNEVVGSPIFLMQLCKNNRHIEIQIVGDESGHACAFSGRDCSTQRRFQKIFEEAPPAIVPPETFREMEKAAQRLTQSIGYIGAGTVEFLYNADTNKFFFLELNPRLQVEHPVSEGITNVNLPATQLQVAMGIPLSNIPEVRRFYGKDDMYGTDDIDFIEDDYPPIDTHVIAARITAENPDEGFKPTAGKIERIKFQSAGNVWGYFCIGPNGGIHEFADSQFGHVFAKSSDREAARKSLVVALKDLEVRGDIRTTVEYLVQLLETDEFKSNAVTTSWLDGLLKEKILKVEKPPHDVVLAAAVFHAFEHVKAETSSVIDSFKKGQVYVGSIPSISSFDLEVPFQDVRYQFRVELVGPETFRFNINGQKIDVDFRETEGALLAAFDGEMHRIVGRAEPLGLRLTLDGCTSLLPNIFDPSELRTDVTGKVVRYLQPNGGEVNKGEGYVEVEAMKMIMTLKAGEDGKIFHSLSPGTVIAGGDLLATLELTDPSRVKKIEKFAGQLDISGAAVAVEPKDALTHTLAGFKNDPEAVVQNAFAGADAKASVDLITETLDGFVRVESIFDEKVPDEVVRDLTKTNIDNLEVAIGAIRAHQQLDMRRKLALAVLRQTATLRDRFDLDHLPQDLLTALEQVRSLKSKDYGDLKIAADTIIQQSNVPQFEVRVEELRSQLLDETISLDELAGKAAVSAGVDMLTYLFTDSDAAVRAASLEAYVRRIYHAYRLLDVSIDKDGRAAKWTYQHMDTPSTSTVRHGVLNVVPSLSTLNTVLPEILNNFGASLPLSPEPLHEVYLVCSGCDESVDIEAVEAKIGGSQFALHKLGIQKVNVVVPVTKQNPLYFTFPLYNDYKEDVARRNMRPTFYRLLELDRLKSNFDLETLHAVGQEVQVFLGTEKSDKPVRGGPPQVVFVRGVSNTPGLTTLKGANRVLQMGLDELERAQANSKVSLKSSSKIFIHSLPLIEGADPAKLAKDFKDIVAYLKSHYATRLLKLRVDQIEGLARLKTPDEKSVPMAQPIRFVASSMDGEWLKPTTLLDYPDPVTGVTRESCVLGEGEDDVCLLDPYESSSILQSKRSIARNVGSTYAYDFLSLLEIGLVGQWDSYIKNLSSKIEIPSGIFESQELVEGPNGDLAPGSRPIGTNKVGMLAWHVTMKTPEYPEGRDMVVIANDVTVKSGSFAVAEDEIYYKASKYARKLKIPRVYIACNAGARIGLYNDLKSKIKLKFFDDENPSQGFGYLYLTDEDYKSLPEGAVNAHKVPEGWALDDIIGTEHGIGVENLQGSGKIAGETSQAYDDVFTLSYVTGRSVGIGAYLVRLGQRIIQKSAGPIILTGFAALNKLLGREVYTSQDQLGGPQIMVPNGVTHLEVENDQAGVDAILEWLSYVPKEIGALPAIRKSSDPVDRSVDWRPTKIPYDPRLLLTGTSAKPGFFDKGSFKEYLSGWGKSVVVGRGRLGGIPMGTIAVETRQVEQIIPADPANPDSSESVLPQAGKVWYPDSAFKTAQAIRDFDKEGLPVMIFANWRGFSGGSRDMAMEVLKFGSMIVDALREFSNPVYIYIPPHGELRGGSWVVLDPTINLDQMEMYADPDSRGGILEPSGIAEIKFRAPDQLEVMHRNDAQLRMLKEELESNAESDMETIKEQIEAREQLLAPVYLQAATEFADLHDKTGRMKAKEVIRDAVPWEHSRKYFYYRAKRRMLQDDIVKRLQAAGSLSCKTAVGILSSICKGEWTDDAAVIDFFENETGLIDANVKRVRHEYLQAQMEAIKAEMEKE